ncbi:tetratricopeptide repeat protein [Dactylosporangium sp. NPDC051541]|uniref:tetratricopeptide repeat protein n=1 Tax=Dactylosporangium sp. NPDC051541 TaxID=3363977 RepID=UPI00379486A1
MPRPERALFPDLSPLHAFAADLRALRVRARNPTYQAMARHTGRSRTALSEAAGGDVIPTWDTVIAYVSFCGEDPNRYRQAWEQLREHREQDSLHGSGTRDPSTVPDAPADLSNLPRRPAGLFLGRDDALQQLEELLQGTDRGLVIGPVVHGLGGVGKTELALQFTDGHRNRYNPVWWINADSVENITAGLAALTRTLEPKWPASSSAGDTAAWAQRWLATHDGWLLVLDNVVDLAAIQPVLATGSNGRVIVTSRRYLDWQTLSLTPLALPVLTADAGIDLLLRRTGRSTERAEAEALVDDVGGLPLALSHAAAYLVERQHVSIAQYRLWLAEQPTRILSARALAHPSDDVVARTWQVSIDAVVADDPLAARMLGIMSYLGADRIPVDLFTPIADALAVEDALTVAASYSLISRSPATISIHRLVQTVIRLVHTDERTLREAVGLLHAALPTGDPETTVAQWPRWAELAPHIDALAARIRDERAEPLTADTTNRAAHVLMWGGFYHRGQGRYDASLALFRHSLQLREDTLGPDHPDTVTSRYGVAGGCWSTGRFAEAIVAARAALQAREMRFGPGHPDTLEIASNIAVGLRELGHHDEAIALTEQTLRYREKILGVEHPETLRSRNNLAGCYRAVGRIQEALTLYRKTLEARTRTLGVDHPDTLQSQNNLAGGYEAAGQIAEAVALYEATLAARQDLLGTDHPDTSHSRFNLANAYLTVGRRDAAVQLLQRTLASQCWLLGADHPDSRKTAATLQQARDAPSQPGGPA